ncbi:MAG: hypothetical protein ACHQSE_14670 [Gemmatimonadales bacterium]
MKASPAPRSQWTRLWIPFGAGLFILGLALAAAVVPQLRLLHAFQALIYVAVILLARRNHAAGFGAGSAVAAAWNSLQLFITHLFQAGAKELWSAVTTGHVRRPDTAAVFVAGIGHFVLFIGCIGAFVQLRPGKREWRQFVIGGVVALGYLVVIVATMRPR